MKKCVLIAIIFFALSCKEKHCNPDCENTATPTARFEYSKFRCENAANSCVQFQNISENTTKESTFKWIFGDGETSDNENPVHKFNDYEEFNVVLCATNCNGNTSYYSETINISYD